MAEVIDRDLGMKDLWRRFAEIDEDDSVTRVGVFAGESREQVSKYQPAIQQLFEAAGLAKPQQDVTNVDIGVWHEFGIPKLHIPERSWLRSAFDANHDKWTKYAAELTKRVLSGKLSLYNALNRLGLLAATDVKKGITTGEGIPPPNSPTTIARKGSSRTLVDSGQFVGAIDHDVVTNTEGD